MSPEKFEMLFGEDEEENPVHIATVIPRVDRERSPRPEIAIPASSSSSLPSSPPTHHDSAERTPAVDTTSSSSSSPDDGGDPATRPKTTSYTAPRESPSSTLLLSSSERPIGSVAPRRRRVINDDSGEEALPLPLPLPEREEDSDEDWRNRHNLGRYLRPENANSPNLRTRTFNVSRESPPMNFDMQLSSDNDTVTASQFGDLDENDDPRGAAGNRVTNNSPSMRPFWDSLATQRELRRLGSYNAQGQREDQDVVTPSRLRTRIRSGAVPRPDENQRQQ